jgi:exodeoxyribonuclease X
MTPEFDDLRFVVVDVEGNGQQPPEVVECAVTYLDGLTIIGTPRAWLVHPTQPITPLVTRKVHGITNADVVHAPTIGQLAPQLLDALADRVPIAHNARVEKDVLRTQLPQWQPAAILDTMRLARKVWPGLKSYSLDFLLHHARITVEADGQRHRAGFDTYATALLFVSLAEAVADRFHLFEWAALPDSTLPVSQSIDEGTLW